MSAPNVELPIIDLSPYLHPQNEGDRDRVVAQIRDACSKYGFFQVSGHGIPLESQHGLLKAIGTFFHQPKETKMKLSFLEDPGRRGYEASGIGGLRAGDKLPDSKESFYIGREEPKFEPPGFHCPNQWPDTLPNEVFRDPVWKYYEETGNLGKTIWEILLLGLGRDPALMDVFTKKPIVQMKMIRYPPAAVTLEGQFGVGAHTDFGGVTVLLQQAGRSGLQVYLDDHESWINVPAIEDVYVINCGDMIAKWSGGAYRSARHRVINASQDEERLSCALFWHGDCDATNPLSPDDPCRDTVGKLLMQRFRSQFSIPDKVIAATK